jgi:hypothetical protein
VSLARRNVRNVTVDRSSRTKIVFQGDKGEQSTWHASLLYQSLVKSMVPENDVRADLEVINIGQSKVRDFARTAIARLDGHEKWETFYRDIVEHNPHREIWILLISQSQPQHLNITIPGVEGRDCDAEEISRRTRHPIQLNPLD